MSENLVVGFIGNPNCGKTTLFNAFTGANLKVANWPGVTVEKVEGALKYHNNTYRLVDLPGTYSLTSYTMEEQVSRQYILSDEVDVIVDVADASSLERNLYLTLQLLELGKPVVLALNMMDIVEKRGMEIDLHRLPEMLGIPVIPVSARKRTGLEILMHAVSHHKDAVMPDKLVHHHTMPSHHKHDHHVDHAMVYSDEIEDKIDSISDALQKKYPEMLHVRWCAIKLLEGDKEISEKYPVDLPQVLDRSYESEIINQKYEFIEEIVQEVLVNKEEKAQSTDKADRILTHPIFGIPIFLGIMALVFLLTFTVGDFISGYFELAVEWLSGFISNALAAAERRLDSKRFFRLLRCIPVERERGTHPEIDCVKEHLLNGSNAIIFPEGARSRDGGLLPLKKGVIKIAKDTGISILPIYIEGGFEIYPRHEKSPKLFNWKQHKRYPLNITVQEPLNPLNYDEQEMFKQLEKKLKGEDL